MLPTFLGIGPARTASTWLNWVLERHPQIQMAVPKECSFFGKMILHHDLRWYQERFEASDHRPPRSIRGDISPWYSRLSARNVRAIHGLLPEAKIVLVLRNPIDRSWSQAMLELGTMRGIPLDRVPIQRILLNCERVRNTRYSDYLTIVRRWTSIYGREAVHLALFDDLIDRPAEFVGGILRHIGVDDLWHPPDSDYTNRLWSSRSQPGGEGLTMPPLVRWYLAMKWIEPVRRLNEHLGGRVGAWVSEMEGIAGEQAQVEWLVRRNLNRIILCMPDRMAYAAYDLLREVRLARRNRKILVAEKNRDSR